MVLWELFDSIVDLNISFSGSTSGLGSCPSAEDLEKRIAANKTIVIVYPGKDRKTCKDVHLPANQLHVRWILSPVRNKEFLNYGEDDLVFNFASSCALYPDLILTSNILQVITAAISCA